MQKPSKDSRDKKNTLATTTQKLLQKYSYLLEQKPAKTPSIEDIVEQIDQYYESIIGSMPGNVYWLDTEGRGIGCNKNVLKMFGFTSMKQFRGLNFEQMGKAGNWKPEATQSFKYDTLQVIKSGRARLNIEEPPIPHSDGRVLYFLTSRVPLFDKKGRVIGVVGISVDISDRKRVEEELRIAKETAEEASDAKTRFIQNMQHDLRTPAAGVSQMLSIICEQEQNPKKKITLEKIAKASKRLLQLLNSILEFDKISSGKLPLLWQKFDIRGLLNDIIDIQSPGAHIKHLEFISTVDPQIPETVISDKNRIFRILLNLISNAIKFTAKGSVKVNLSIAKKISPQKLLLKLTVTDTGIGIPKDKQYLIYERFERGSAANSSIYSGSGLGLSIAKQFVDELHGEIDVQSTEGKGSTFTCIIPCSLPLMDLDNYEEVFNKLQPNKNSAPEPPQPSSEPAKNINAKNSKILVIEDDEIAQIIARDIFTNKLKTKLDIAKTGKEALKLFANNQYSIIFTDVGLPDTTGDKIVREIRKTNEQIPIIAVTAHDSKDVQKRCLKSGVNEFLIKPLNIEKAVASISHWLKQTPTISSTSNSSAKQSKQTTRKNKILVKKLTKIFITNLRKYRQEIDKSIKNKNINKLYSILLRLRGAASYVEASQIQLIVKQILKLIETQPINFTALNSSHQELNAEIEKIEKSRKVL